MSHAAYSRSEYQNTATTTPPAKTPRQRRTNDIPTTPVIPRTTRIESPAVRAQRKAWARQNATVVPKTVYLVRHGQSAAQLVLSKPERQSNVNLHDCALTDRGRAQARALPTYFADNISVNLVVSSPLTRALETALLAFLDQNILVHYDLTEIGTSSENTPRPMEAVLTDLSGRYGHGGGGGDKVMARVDYSSLQPSSWPPRVMLPTVVRKARVQEFAYWLATRPEAVIVVVCHYHVMRHLLSSSSYTLHHQATTTTPKQQQRQKHCDSPGSISSSSIMAVDIKPQNAVPIHCRINEHGDLIVVSPGEWSR